MSKIAILDLDSIAYAVGNPNKVLDETGQPIKVLSEAGNMVFKYVEKTEEQLKQSADFVMNSILTACGCTHYIGYIKGKDTTKFRLEINSGYKGNRTKEAPWWWDKVKNYLVENWGAIVVNDVEVDDICNITYNYYARRDLEGYKKF